MSRFIVTSGSDFRPFSYDELMKPVQASAEAHAAAADAYDQLSMETEALGRYISQNEGDVEARALYDNYVKKLGDLQNNLWGNGFTARTRRDLSSARAAYAGDIQRLKDAITARQERSKEYWDARHKNPDLVVGFDPGIGGLDNYLNDSEYGRNWYSYSGNQFASEVGAEAKARASELLSSYVGKSDVPGYLEYIQRNGFTNQQVNNAGVLAQQILSGQVSPNDPNIDPIEGLLANTLISRLQATGAMPGQNLSAEEFGRMFNYGMLGLTQGIGEVNQKLIDNKEWDELQARRRIALQHPSTSPSPTSGPGYSIDSTSTYIENPDFAKLNRQYGRYVHDYNESPIVYMNNGQLDALTSEADGERLLDSMGRASIQEEFGVDPQLSFNRRGKNAVTTQFVLPNGNKIDVRYVKMSAGQQRDYAAKPYVVNQDGFDYTPIAVEQFVDGHWIIDEDKTDEFNRRNKDYQIQRQRLLDENKKNSDFDLDKIALTGKSKQKYYKNNNIPSYVPVEYARDVANAMNIQGNVTPAYIAHQSMGDALEHYSGQIETRYAKIRANAGKDGIGKASPEAFYQVLPGGRGYSKSGETNDAVIFGTKGTGKNEKVEYKIREASVTPEDIYRFNKVRIITGNGKVWGIDPLYLGDAVNSVFDILRGRNAVVWDRATKQYKSINVDDEHGLLHYLELPLSDPARVSVMSPEEQQKWYDTAYEYLGAYNMPFSIPDMRTGEYIPVGPIQILTDETLQGALRNSITGMLNTVMSQPRDWAVQERMKTTEKAKPYLGR